MNIIITGGAGFIGSNLSVALLKHHNVICVDNEATGNKNNILDLLKFKNFKYVNADISTYNFENIKADVVFNLACPTPPLFVKNNPELVQRASHEGTINLINFAEKNNSKIVHVSSVRVDEDPVGANVYSDSKRLSEELIKSYKNSTIIRLASVFGPKMMLSDSRVIPQFIQKALKNEDIIIWGTGEQLDTFAYIEDVVTYFINSITSNNGLYTIGSKEPISIKDLANKIIALTNSSSKIQHIPNYTSTRTLNYLDKIDSNFYISVDLISGLQQTVNYFKSISTS